MLAAFRELYGWVAVDETLMKAVELFIFMSHCPDLAIELHLHDVLSISPAVQLVLRHSYLSDRQGEWKLEEVDPHRVCVLCARPDMVDKNLCGVKNPAKLALHG
jgi:hypothetical protein